MKFENLKNNNLKHNHVLIICNLCLAITIQHSKHLKQLNQLILETENNGNKR